MIDIIEGERKENKMERNGSNKKCCCSNKSDERCRPLWLSGGGNCPALLSGLTSSNVGQLVYLLQTVRRASPLNSVY